MSKQDKINSFDPNGLGDANNNIYGLPFSVDEAEVVILPVPWEVTVSYSGGTALGPQVVYNASYQVDLFDPKIADAWKIGLVYAGELSSEVLPHEPHDVPLDAAATPSIVVRFNR